MSELTSSKSVTQGEPERFSEQGMICGTLYHGFFQTRPVTKEAALYSEANLAYMPQHFVRQICDCDEGVAERLPGVHIHTLEGPHTVEDGDWIIKGLKGEFYPCKPEVFKLSYKHIGAAQPSPVVQTPEEQRICEGCGEMLTGNQTSHSRADHAKGCNGNCKNCPVEVECGPVVPVGETKDTCLLCHWEPDEKKGEHLPKVVSGAVYVCTECDTRCKTVDSFGLTIEELRKAAAAYKSALPATEKEK